MAKKNKIYNQEVIKEVPGFKGQYYVTSFGRVFTLKFRNNIPQLQLMPGTPAKKSRYLVVTFYTPKKRKRVTKYIHALVCRAFHGRRPKGYQVAHKDGSRDNNRADNLCWKTPLDNNHDRYIHNTVPYGTKSNTSKLIDRDIINIRNIWCWPKEVRPTQSELAKWYGVCTRTIYRVVNNLGWKHVK